MGVGKAVLCSHGPSSIVWSENEPCCRSIAYFIGRIRGQDLVWYNMSQILSIWDNYLVVFVCPIICPGICHAICLESCHIGIKIKIKIHGLAGVPQARSLKGGPDKKFGRPWNLIHNLPCKTPCRLFIHKLFLWAFRPSTLCVKWTWTVSALSTNESS